MRILTNEYYTSLPGSEKKAHGGPGTFAVDFSQYVCKSGHTWIGLLATKKDFGSDYRKKASRKHAEYIEILSNDKTSIEGLRELTSPITPTEYLKDEILYVSEIMRKLQPDIMFLNGFSAYSWLLYAAAKKCNLPIVFQHAGIMKREVEQYEELFSEIGRNMCYEMELDATLGVDVNIFLNEYCEKELAHCYNLDSVPQSIIIPLPHAGWIFDPIKKVPSGSNITIGVVARWDRIKNHPAILALAEEINKQSLPWKIEVVTTIPKTNKFKEMKSRYRELIEVVPPMGRTELREFYSKIDIALLPSNFDAAGAVVMEALATGIPTLISPSVGWVSEYDENNMNEWIVSFDNPSDVVTRIQNQLRRDSWPEVSSLSNYIKTIHAPDNVYNAYLNVFEKTFSSNISK
ncbi:glycosyltransferase family 4 protein [Candidatus Gracilibacteria bacterium]|nr:glycosyltransferase family 4 protein [Candidatus Gracilibacteria bacterium]MCF7898625.1 glycosyltransferase family 4 protein [Candidatus Paceibacterota bacterium]